MFGRLSPLDVDSSPGENVLHQQSGAPPATMTVCLSIPLPVTDFFCNSTGTEMILEVRFLWATATYFAVLHSAVYVFENIGKHPMSAVLYFVIKYFEDSLLSSLSVCLPRPAP